MGIAASPAFLTHMGIAGLPCLNEATWVTAGLLPPHWVESRRWQKLQVAASVYGLAVVVFLSCPSGLITTVAIAPRMLRGERLVAHIVMLLCALGPVLQAPFVQVPMLRSGVRKLLR
eukprot:NODE_3673_length_757_cov_200.343305.p4 GENE.NODE_3673_length_757_cov_200.343305~~NODE_3673_length_757_cov_200.343305.p4  ORF type:complete len:117 (+),score=24.77 NODE_3673_length_757_cov_200.343305:3-353(+)